MSVVYRLRSIFWPVAAVAVAVGLVACSSGEGVATMEPLVTESPELPALPDPVAAATVEPEPEKKPAPLQVATEASEPITTTVTAPEPEPVATESPAHPAEPEPVATESPAHPAEPEPVATESPAHPAEPELTAEQQYLLDWHEYQKPTPLEEFVGFPDDVALIYYDKWSCYEGCSRLPGLYRIYRQNGELVRDELLDDYHPLYGTTAISMPDGSRMAATVCYRAPCEANAMAGVGDYDHHGPPLPTTDLYESLDGGVTWHYLDTLERPWRVAAITEDQVFLSSFNFRTPVWGAYMFWPSMELDVWTEREPWPTGGEFEAMIAEIEGYDRAAVFALAGELPSKWDPVVAPKGDRILPVAVQLGPFLRVADLSFALDVGYCLPVLAEPSPDAKELDCMVARVLLQDQGETVELGGVTLHKVKTPAGVTGWADGRHLE